MYLQGLQGKIGEFEAEGVQWIVIGDDAAERLAEMKAKIGLTNVPFLVDSTGNVGRDQYGLVYTPGDHEGHLEPGVFLLAPNRNLVAGSYVTGPHGRFPVDNALRLAKMLKENMAKGN
jgi:peroxiredoxin